MSSGSPLGGLLGDLKKTNLKAKMRSKRGQMGASRLRMEPNMATLGVKVETLW